MRAEPQVHVSRAGVLTPICPEVFARIAALAFRRAFNFHSDPRCRPSLSSSSPLPRIKKNSHWLPSSGAGSPTRLQIE